MGDVLPKCSIESKNAGGKIFSSLQIVSMMESMALSMIETRIPIAQISLKNKLSSVKTFHIGLATCHEMPKE